MRSQNWSENLIKNRRYTWGAWFFFTLDSYNVDFFFKLSFKKNWKAVQNSILNNLWYDFKLKGHTKNEN